MTIVVARKILGACAFEMTDAQVQEVINCFSGIIEVGLQIFKEPKGDKTDYNGIDTNGRTDREK